MPSPFPGMDPYLESRWSSVHILMISAVTALLKRVLPEGLEARPEEDVRIETLSELRLGTRSPDVAITRAQPAGVAVAAEPARTSAMVMAEPLRIVRYRQPIKLRRIQIVDTLRGGQVITAIEILSPQNKAAGVLNRSYRKRIRLYERASVNWVEIDLLRSTRKRLAIDWSDVPPERRADYLALTYRAPTGELDAYPLSLRSPLPGINVPLRGATENVPLDLQAAFDRVWDDGPFGGIDYSRPADPPLSPEDAAWFAERLAQRAVAR